MTYLPYPRYQDSGVEWLGSIPEHWQVRRLGKYGRFVAGCGFPHEYQGTLEGDYPFYKVSDTNIQGNEVYLDIANNYVTKETARLLGASIARKGGIMFPKVGAALLGNKRRILRFDSITDNNTMVFEPYVGDSKFWFYWMSILDFGNIANAGPVPSVNESQLRDFVSICPPPEEQKAISEFLDRETSKIDDLVVRLAGLDGRSLPQSSGMVGLLNERRIALISAAVTGKIDVRNAV